MSAPDQAYPRFYRSTGGALPTSFEHELFWRVDSPESHPVFMRTGAFKQEWDSSNVTTEEELQASSDYAVVSGVPKEVAEHETFGKRWGGPEPAAPIPYPRWYSYKDLNWTTESGKRWGYLRIDGPAENVKVLFDSGRQEEIRREEDHYRGEPDFLSHPDVPDDILNHPVHGPEVFPLYYQWIADGKPSTATVLRFDGPKEGGVAGADGHSGLSIETVRGHRGLWARCDPPAEEVTPKTFPQYWGWPPRPTEWVAYRFDNAEDPGVFVHADGRVDPDTGRSLADVKAQPLRYTKLPGNPFPAKAPADTDFPRYYRSIHRDRHSRAPHAWVNKGAVVRLDNSTDYGVYWCPGSKRWGTVPSNFVNLTRVQSLPGIWERLPRWPLVDKAPGSDFPRYYRQQGGNVIRIDNPTDKGRWWGKTGFPPCCSDFADLKHVEANRWERLPRWPVEDETGESKLTPADFQQIALYHAMLNAKANTLKGDTPMSDEPKPKTDAAVLLQLAKAITVCDQSLTGYKEKLREALARNEERDIVDGTVRYRVVRYGDGAQVTTSSVERVEPAQAPPCAPERINCPPGHFPGEWVSSPMNGSGMVGARASRYLAWADALGQVFKWPCMALAVYFASKAGLESLPLLLAWMAS